MNLESCGDTTPHDAHVYIATTGYDLNPYDWYTCGGVPSQTPED